MVFNRKNFTNELLLNLYKGILKPRMIEEKMILLVRQGKINKWFSAWGQEAISVGIAFGLQPDEWIFPSHRNLGIFVNRGLPLENLYAQFQGKAEGFSNGRERSFHFGSKKHFIAAMISHSAAQLPVACGVAFGNLLQSKPKATVVICGEGATSQGDFHEAINLAAVWSLPVIFVVENNGFGLSTPVYEQFNCTNIIDKAPGYGIDALQVDGNNILEVYDVISQMAQNIRNNPRPILIEAITFRMRGHEEAADNDFVSKELLEKWKAKDPVARFEKYLIDEFVLSQTNIETLKSEFKLEIEQNFNRVDTNNSKITNFENELKDVYAPHVQIDTEDEITNGSEIKFIEAIQQTLNNNLEKYPNLVLYGQDVAAFGGVFKVTSGLFEKFGKERIKNTPLSESVLIGASLGLAINNCKSIVEIQFADFVSNAFSQIINNLAKSHYRWGQKADVVIRLPTGGGVGAGPFHSQSPEGYFFHTPGLKIVYPSSAKDAKGLLNSAVEDPNPVLFFEHKAFYRTIKDNVPDDDFYTPIGKAKILKTGSDLTIITYGMGVHWALEVVQQENFDAQIVDLRSLLPWDKDLVFESVRKTGKAIVLTEDTITGSLIAEIAAEITEKCFTSLDAPVFRLGSLDTPVPFANELEQNYLPKNKLKTKLLELLQY